MNLRFAGQYFDSESNLSYNYFRSYRPAQGRYDQSDLIGLGGGWNRFGYANQNALGYTDPYGLFVPLIIRGVCAAGGCEAIGGFLAAGALWWANHQNDNLIFNRPKNPPDVGPPGGFIQGPKRGRQYCPDGTPETDFDKPHQGADYPHIHDWPGGVRDDHGGRPYSPWPRQSK